MKEKNESGKMTVAEVTDAANSLPAGRQAPKRLRRPGQSFGLRRAKATLATARDGAHSAVAVTINNLSLCVFVVNKYFVFSAFYGAIKIC
ncbi:hypothetical protein IIA15_06020 [candidate division TA06 bacterium]|nr:hypothetical protein [candidate division TA06 bacterium]